MSSSLAGRDGNFNSILLFERSYSEKVECLIDQQLTFSTSEDSASNIVMTNMHFLTSFIGQWAPSAEILLCSIKTSKTEGISTAGTLKPLPTEPLDIPPLNLSGTLPEQQNAIVDLDLNSASQAPGGGAAADFTAWPEFHNGVAAGEFSLLSGYTWYLAYALLSTILWFWSCCVTHGNSYPTLYRSQPFCIVSIFHHVQYLAKRCQSSIPFERGFAGTLFTELCGGPNSLGESRVRDI